jgi:hypothetical protein
MKGRSEDELRDATFYVDLTGENGILRADSEIVNAVIADLGTTFRELTSGGDSSETHPRLPTPFNDETESYKPLADLLNKIIATVNSHILSPSLLRDLRIHPFGYEINEILGSQKPLKPDVVGVIGDLPTKTSVEQTAGRRAKKSPSYDVLWKLVHLVIESKLSIRDMLRQLATYARCCLLCDQRRFFSLGIGFQYKTFELYVYAFHHAGLSSSRPLKIKTADGFKGLVEHIVGILSIKDEAAYGLDPTRFQDLFYINDRCYKSVHYIHVRGNLRGRSTIVHSLEGMYMRILGAGLHLFIAYPAAKNTVAHNMESRMLTLAPGVQTLPDKLTYKLTYQVKGQSQEGPLLSEFNGQFGIADVIGYHICGTEEPHGSTGRLFNNAEFWSAFEQKGLSGGSPPIPEERGLECIAFSSEGKAFLDVDIDGGIPSPGELLESILHAIIGE